MSRQEIGPSPKESPRSLWLRWLLRVVAAIGVLIVVLLGALVWLANNLDRPWIKRRVQALVLQTGRVEVDYGAVTLGGLSEVEIDDLILRSPTEVRAFAAEMVRIGRVRARWSPRALLGGRGPVVQQLIASTATLTVVVDETGRTSFDAIPASPNPSPSTPLSQLPPELVGVGSYLQQVQLDDVRVVLVRTAHGKTVERDHVQGLKLDLRVAPLAPSARLVLALGSPKQPLELTAERHRDEATSNVAKGRLSLNVEMGPNDAKMALDVQILQQDLAPGYTLDRLAHLDAEAQFDGGAGQTKLTIKRVELGDGAAVAEALLRLPDRGSSVLETARADADLARVLRLLPPDLVPVRLRQGELHGHVNNLVFDRPNADATFALEGKGADVEVTLPNGSFGFGSTSFSLKVQSRDAGLDAQGTALLDGLRVAAGATSLQGDHWTLTLAGKKARSGAYTGQTELKFASLDVIRPLPVAVRDGHVDLQARELLIDQASPLATHGDLSVEANAELAECQAQGRVIAASPKLSVHVNRAEAGAWTLATALGVARMRVLKVDGRELLNAPINGELRLKELEPNLERPEESQGVAQVQLEAGALRATVDATKRAATLDYVASATVSGLGEVYPWLPAGSFSLAVLDQIAFELQSKGRVERLTATEPSLEHHTKLRLAGLELGKIAVRSMDLELKSSGTAMQHQLHADARVAGIKVNDLALKDDHLTVAVMLDRTKPSLQLAVDEAGLSKLKLRAKLGFDRTQRALTHDITGQISDLAPALPLLLNVPALTKADLSKLDVALKTQGSVVGVVTDVDAAGRIRWSPEPQHTWSGQSAVELQVAHLDWDDGTRAVRIPAAALRIGVQGERERRTVVSDLQIDGMDVGLGSRWIKLSDVRHHSSATLAGRYHSGSVELAQQLSVRAVQQNLVSAYPVGDFSLDSTIRRSADGVLKLSKLELENRAAGTSLSMSGGFDVLGDLPRVALRTSLRQDLARISTNESDLVGRGKAVLDLSVESPDLRVLHTEALMRLEDAHVHVPSKNIVLDDVNGEVPIECDIVLDRHGVELMHGSPVNPYMAHRFADQHPLLSHRSFLSIGSLKTPLVSIAPFAANLEIRQNVLSLSQLEMGLRGGSVAGNGVFVWNGAKSKLHADLRASGVQSSYGEPFDGNSSLVVDLADHSIEGRADILRVGRRHLLDMLDLLDPYHADAGINRIRSVLTYGYPERVNIAFKHGFASAGVHFGGLASLVSVDEIRGIPVGPLIDRVLGSIKTEETP